MAKGFVSELVAPGPSSVTRCGVLAPDVRARCGSPPMLYTYLTTLSPDRDAGTEETTDKGWGRGVGGRVCPLQGGWVAELGGTYNWITMVHAVRYVTPTRANADVSSSSLAL